MQKFQNNKKMKKPGYLIPQAILALTAFTMMSYGLVIAFSSSFNMYGASKTAMEAQQYAEVTADSLKLVAYDKLSTQAHGKKNISYASGWQDEVSIGGETVIDATTGNKMRIAKVNVYKTGDTTPRYTVNVPLTSQGGSNNNGMIPSYSIAEEKFNIQEYIVPDNGWLYIETLLLSRLTGVILVDDVPVDSFDYGSDSAWKSCFIPVKKGNHITLRHCSNTNYTEPVPSYKWPIADTTSFRIKHLIYCKIK